MVRDMEKKKKTPQDQGKPAKKKTNVKGRASSEKSEKPRTQASAKKKKQQTQATAPTPEKKSAAVTQPPENDKKEKRPLYLRISIKAAKILFIWFPLTLVSVIIIALIFAHIYFTAPRVEKLITENFNSMSEGTLSMNVREFRPYTGFVIEDILIRNGREFNNSKLFEMKKMVFRYGFFPMFAGNIRFPEIGFYKPRLYLEQKNGAWSAEKLMKPGPEKPAEEKPDVEKKEEHREKGETSGDISLPVSVEFFMKFVLDDLQVFVKGEDFRTTMKGLTFTADIDVPPFSTIPRSADAVMLLKKMHIVLNPKEELAVSYYSADAEVSPELILTWRLAFNRDGRSAPAFNSSFKFGTYRLPVRLKKTYLTPLKFMVSYDMRYDPNADRLDLNHFRVRFRKSTWLNLTGTVSSASAEQRINMKMTKSRIVLSELYPYYLKLTGDRRTRFSGGISLYPLTITGTPDRLNINGTLSTSNIYFKNPSAEASIPRLAFKYGVLKNGDNMKITSRVFMPHMYYILEGSRSGDNGLELTADLLAENSFSSVTLNSIGFRFFSPELRKNALAMNLEGAVDLGNDLSGKISINRFTFMKQPLAAMVP